MKVVSEDAQHITFIFERHDFKAKNSTKRERERGGQSISTKMKNEDIKGKGNPICKEKINSEKGKKNSTKNNKSEYFGIASQHHPHEGRRTIRAIEIEDFSYSLAL